MTTIYMCTNIVRYIICTDKLISICICVRGINCAIWIQLTKTSRTSKQKQNNKTQRARAPPPKNVQLPRYISWWSWVSRVRSPASPSGHKRRRLRRPRCWSDGPRAGSLPGARPESVAGRSAWACRWGRPRSLPPVPLGGRGRSPPLEWPRPATSGGGGAWVGVSWRGLAVELLALVLVMMIIMMIMAWMVVTMVPLSLSLVITTRFFIPFFLGSMETEDRMVKATADMRIFYTEK